MREFNVRDVTEYRTASTQSDDGKQMERTFREEKWGAGGIWKMLCIDARALHWKKKNPLLMNRINTGGHLSCDNKHICRRPLIQSDCILVPSEAEWMQVLVYKHGYRMPQSSTLVWAQFEITWEERQIDYSFLVTTSRISFFSALFISWFLML